MTLPFTVTTWLVMVVVFTPNDTHFLSGYDQWATNQFFTFIPQWLQGFFLTLSAVVLQMNILAGMIIAAAILIYSRIALLLIILGYSIGVLCQYLLGIDSSSISYQYLAFNYMLVALVIGGVALLPSFGSVILASAATVLTVFITLGLHHLFPMPFSPLAMPFNLVAWLLLLTLHKNDYPIQSIVLTPNTDVKPEEKVAIYRSSCLLDMNIALPFDGRWQITQGIYGQFKHKERHYFAYDFMAVNENNALYDNGGFYLKDFYSYGKPVLALADGVVALVSDHIPDNPIGQLNAVNNWGNVVIIQHADHVYSCVAHLQPDTIQVTEQQTVSQGTVIGYCGNSGVSRYPHLHVQFQSAPILGINTIPFDFSSIIVNDKPSSGGILMQSTVVQNVSGKRHATVY